MRFVITGCAVILAIIHLTLPSLAIDGVTTSLLLVAIIPWLQPLFKSLEFPGGVKVEFQELVNVGERADAAGLLATSSPEKTQSYSFQLIASTDPNLALAGLRIELERLLDQLARSRGYEGSVRGIGNLLRYLYSKDLIDGNERAVLNDLVGLLNAAVHGAQADSKTAEWALDIGPQILEALGERIVASQTTY